MKNWIFILMPIMVSSVVLAACGGETASIAVEAAGAAASQLDEVNPTAAIAAVAGNDATLSTDYRDALPLDMQLAFGTMQLEDTNLAITVEQATAILPYWRVLQSLKQSGNAADAEITAVVRQIQNGMNSEQIAAIGAMELTEESVQTRLEEGSLVFDRGSGQAGEASGSGGGFRGGGGLPGGGGPGGGGPGGFGGNQGDLATRQAEMEASGENPMKAVMERMSANMIIRLLEIKTGEEPVVGGFGGLGTAYTVVRELTGLSEEELGEAMAEGQTLSAIVEANGVSLAEAREAMMEAMADVLLREGQDPESWIGGLLSGDFGGRPARGTQ